MVSDKSPNGSHSSAVSESTLKPDITVEELNQLYARASVQRFDEIPRYPSSFSGGVMPMNIRGRFDHERERLGPDFNETERQWRIKWMKDQELHPSEPFQVKQLYNEYHNGFRRFYRKPLDLFQNSLSQYIGREGARTARNFIGKGFLGYLSFLGIYYYIKYNGANWEKDRGIRVNPQREMILPGDVRFPREDPRTESWQHFDRGFHKRKTFLNE